MAIEIAWNRKLLGVFPCYDERLHEIATRAANFFRAVSWHGDFAIAIPDSWLGPRMGKG
jgi:hypothetical protein